MKIHAHAACVSMAMRGHGLLRREGQLCTGKCGGSRSSCGTCSQAHQYVYSRHKQGHAHGLLCCAHSCRVRNFGTGARHMDCRPAAGLRHAAEAALLHVDLKDAEAVLLLFRFFF